MSTKQKRFYCGHCKEYVTKTVYFQHRRLYFESNSGRWSKVRLFSSDFSHGHAQSSHTYDSMTVIDEQVQEPCNEQTIQVLSEEGNLLFTHQLSPQLVIYIS